MLKYIFQEKNFTFWITPVFSWFNYSLFWQFCWSHYYLDEMFSRFFISFIKNISDLSSYTLDKWFSTWTGSGLNRILLQNFSIFNTVTSLENYNFFIVNILFLINFFLLFVIIFFIC